MERQNDKGLLADLIVFSIGYICFKAEDLARHTYYHIINMPHKKIIENFFPYHERTGRVEQNGKTR